LSAFWRLSRRKLDSVLMRLTDGVIALPLLRC